MRVFYVLFSVITVLIIVIIYLFTQRVVSTMQYFPPDETASIEKANTVIKSQVDNNTVIWSVYSKSNGTPYLRQDVSLLYANGQFKGLLNQWHQSRDVISMEQTFPLVHSTLLQSISFHHGEIHNQSDKITSIQKMTSDELLLPPKITLKKAEWTPILFEKKLSNHWQDLLHHFNYSTSDYNLVPLVDFATYQHTPLPNRSETATKKIVGQFWEGLYKNYFITLSEFQDKIPTHWMPVVLLSKDQSHLIMLYEIEGEKHQLIQKTN